METSAKANINVENVCSCSLLNHLLNKLCFHYDLYMSWFIGIFDTCQRHQVKNGHKIGKKDSLILSLLV